MNTNRVILGLIIALGCTSTAVAQVGNTAYGANALPVTIGNNNSAFGYRALEINTNASDNTAIGAATLIQNSSGVLNTAIGSRALFGNTSGSNNTAAGMEALYFNTTGADNTATGVFALYSNTIGSQNTANGRQVLYSNTTGNHNSAIGFQTLESNTTGSFNSASGEYALYGNTTGSYNAVSGESALYYNTTGNRNVAVGSYALYSNTVGNNNEAIGSRALYSNATGSNNIGIGSQAGYFANGSNNIEIGNNGLTADNNVIRIGTRGTQKATYLAGVRGVNVTGGVAVMVTSTGQFGVVSSSRRYKENIRSMGDTSDRLLKLRPVTFRYKKADENGQKPEQYGLIAEEVAKVMPELVVYNDKGQPETVAYQTLTPLLLNELQREHTQFQTEVDALRAEVAELRRAIAKK